NAGRSHVVLFCNWLSVREGRRPCYRRGDPDSFGGWACDFSADGYRLPTEAEWEHAPRAGSSTPAFFRQEAPRLPMYGHVALQATASVGSKLPSRWGLFDVVGNLWEATIDNYCPLPGGWRLSWPLFGGSYGHSTAMRGGSYSSGSNDCLADGRA